MSSAFSKKRQTFSLFHCLHAHSPLRFPELVPIPLRKDAYAAAGEEDLFLSVHTVTQRNILFTARVVYLT